MDRGEHLLFFSRKFLLVHKYSHSVNPGGHMLEGNTMHLKGFQNLSAESDFRIHHIFFHIDRHKTFFSRNSRNGIKGWLAGIFHN